MQILSTIKSLPLNKYEVSICCYYEYDIEIVKMFRSVCKNVVLMNLKREKGHFCLLQKLFSLFREIQPDVVHVQYLAPGLIPIIAARLAGMRKVIATVHIAGSYAYGTKAKVLLRIASFFCDRFICVSQGVEKFWFGDSQIFEPGNAQNNRKHYTVYNAIDINAIAKAINTTDKTKIKRAMDIEGRPVIGIVGRLAEQKGHAILLDTMTQIVKEISDIILIVIGDGPEKQKLIEKATDLKLVQHILWLGALPQNKVFEYYAIMDIFVMPSLYEGFGLTAAEAMAAGLPVVGTKIEGLSEVIEDGISGYLVQPSNSQALSNALLSLLKDPSKAKVIAQNGCSRVENLFSLEKFKNSMIRLYNSL